MIRDYRFITEEILDMCESNDTFIKPLIKPLEELVKEDKWFIQRYTKQLYIFHPLEIVKNLDNWKVKCLAYHGVNVMKHSITYLDIGCLYTAKEITSKQMLEDLNAAFAKLTLIDDLPITAY